MRRREQRGNDPRWPRASRAAPTLRYSPCDAVAKSPPPRMCEKSMYAHTAALTTAAVRVDRHAFAHGVAVITSKPKVATASTATESAPKTEREPFRRNVLSASAPSATDRPALVSHHAVTAGGATMAAERSKSDALRLLLPAATPVSSSAWTTRMASATAPPRRGVVRER